MQRKDIALIRAEDLQDIIAMLGIKELSQEDRRTVYRARRLERFLTPPFAVTEQFTGRAGNLVPLQDALEGCERIFHDEFADYPERARYRIGSIDEAAKRELGATIFRAGNLWPLISPRHPGQDESQSATAAATRWQPRKPASSRPESPSTTKRVRRSSTSPEMRWL